MSEELAVIQNGKDTQTIVNMVLDGLSSVNSRRAYEKALTDFMAWFRAGNHKQLSKAVVQEYKTCLQAEGLKPATINLRMSAIRRLAAEAADNGLIDTLMANGIGRVKGVKSAGTRAGNWLTREQTEELLNTPDGTTLKGVRDRALLCVMVGCGLRRSEAAALTFGHFQQRDGRWVIVDLVGKGNRTRTVPMPSWTKAALDAWTGELNTHTGLVFWTIDKGGNIRHEGMTSQAVHDVVKLYAGMLGFSLAAHDLRRTFAKLAHKGGAALEQIQLSLGHASLRTTERYLGVTQNLTDAPCDHLGLRM